MSLKQTVNLNDDAAVNELSALIQKDEISNLQAIYMQDIEILKAKAPIRINIYIEPYIEEDLLNQQNIVKANLTIDLPIDYPVRQQRLNYQFDGITSHFTKELNMKAVQICEDIVRYHEKCAEEKEYGQAYQPIIYHIAEALRDWFYDLSMNYQNDFENFQKHETDNILYIPPMPKFATNTPVTEETFLIWKRKFEQELFELKKQSNKFQLEDEQNSKLSGRQYFERRHNLAQQENQENQEENNVDEDAEEVNVADFKQQEDEEEFDNQPFYEREEEEEEEEEDEDDGDYDYDEEGEEDDEEQYK